MPEASPLGPVDVLKVEPVSTNHSKSVVELTDHTESIIPVVPTIELSKFNALGPDVEAVFVKLIARLLFDVLLSAGILTSTCKLWFPIAEKSAVLEKATVSKLPGAKAVM